MNREAWLDAAVEAVSPLMGHPVPKVKVSTGWPSRGGLGTAKKVLGECWKPEVAEDGISQIFLNPTLVDPVEILGVLVHELIHAIHPTAGHKGAFVQTAREVGLTGKWTATTIGEDLHPTLVQIAETLGEYPHSRLNPSLQRKVQTTRMLKLTAGCCGYVVRTTQKWIDVGLPVCPCGTEMEVA